MSSYKIKVVTEGASQAANDLSKLGDSAKTTGEKVEGASGKTFKAAEAFKKLGQAVPGVGGVLDALKNPFTTFGLLTAMAVRSINSFIDAVDKMAESVQAVDGLSGKVTKFFDVIAQQKVEADAFAEKMKAIGMASKDAAQWLKEANLQIERKFKLEEQNDKDGDPVARERRRTVERATALDNAARRAREDAAIAVSALPGARDALTAERKAAREVIGRAGAGDVDANARESFLVEQNKEIEKNLARPAFLRGRLSADPLYTNRSGEDLQGLLEQNRNELNIIGAGRSVREMDRVKAGGRLSRAEGVVSGLEARATGGLEAARGFAADAAGEFAAADVGFQRPNTMGPGSLQFRRDAQVAAIGQRQQAADLAAAITALNQLTAAIIRSAADAGRALANQSQNSQ
jgi:hypothetical protein